MLKTFDTSCQHLLQWLLLSALATSIVSAESSLLQAALCNDSADFAQLQGVSALTKGLRITVASEVFHLPVEHIDNAAGKISLMDAKTGQPNYISKGTLTDNYSQVKEKLAGSTIYRVFMQESLHVVNEIELDVFAENGSHFLWLPIRGNDPIPGAPFTNLSKSQISGAVYNYTAASWIVFAPNASQSDEIVCHIMMNPSGTEPGSFENSPKYFVNVVDETVKFVKDRPEPYTPLVEKLPIFGFVFDNKVHLWKVLHKTVMLFDFDLGMADSAELKVIPFGDYFSCDQPTPKPGPDPPPNPDETTTSQTGEVEDTTTAGTSGLLYLIAAVGLTLFIILLGFFICMLKRSKSKSKSKSKSALKAIKSKSKSLGPADSVEKSLEKTPTKKKKQEKRKKKKKRDKKDAKLETSSSSSKEFSPGQEDSREVRKIKSTEMATSTVKGPQSLIGTKRAKKKSNEQLEKGKRAGKKSKERTANTTASLGSESTESDSSESSSSEADQKNKM